MTKKRPKIDYSQKSLFEEDFGYTEEDKIKILGPQLRRISHENHIEDSKLIKDNDQHTFDFIDLGQELNKKEDQNLRSEQIYVNDPYYNKIFSMICRYSKSIFNSSIYEIRQSQKENFNKNADDTLSTEEQRKLRLKISDILKDKQPGYQTNIYQLLDQYFRTSNNENYISIPQQSAQQTIKLATDALFSNEQSKLSYHLHPWDYTGPPGDIGYKEEGYGCTRGESIYIFTNQQCHIERKSRPKRPRRKNNNNKEDSPFPDSPFMDKNCLTFPKDLRKILKKDSLSIEPIVTRLPNYIDLRHVRIIPLYIGYKIEIVYKKVISEKLERLIEKFKDVSKDRFMGIDIGVNNTMAIGCLDLSGNKNEEGYANIIGNHPILIIGKYLKSINQWFNKMTSELYSIYMRQQGFKGEESKGQSVKMGKKFKTLAQNRDNFFKDIFHKLSNFIIKYCLHFRIGTIVIDWSKGIKQKIDMGKTNNQNFVYIPFSTKLIMMIKYKARLLGIKVIIQNGAYTSLSSFVDDEPFDWTAKNIKYGGLKNDQLGRIHRGMFRTNKGIQINDDIMSSYNQIRKYRIAIGKPIGKCIPNIDKINGVVDGMLHPICLRIEKLLSEGSKSLISMIRMKKLLGNNNIVTS